MKNIFRNSTFSLAIALILSNCGQNTSEAIEIGNNTSETMPAGSEMIEVNRKQFEHSKMKLGQLVDYEFSTSINVTGVVEVPVSHHIQVSVYAGGYVGNIDLIPGEWVHKGQLLFTLENPEFIQMQQEYLEARAQLAFLQSDYERQKTLANENIASQKNFLKAESDYQMTLAKVEGLKKRLSLIGIAVDKIAPENLVSRISVHAQSAGYVTQVSAVQGMYLNPKDVAIELINTEHLHLELSVFEKDILQIKKGQKIHFKTPDANPEIFDAEVYLIGKSVEGDNRVINVHGHFDEKKYSEKFVPGMFVEAKIITASYVSKGLPESAVIEADDKYYVLVHKGDANEASQFEKLEITPGIRENGIVQILNYEALGTAENILVEGAFNLIQSE